MDNPQNTYVQPDEWHALKTFTSARIALGSTGVSLPLKAVLDLRLAHAKAKDAVYSSLDINGLQEELEKCGSTVYHVKSRASNRDVYLHRPDLGRLLDETSYHFIKELAVVPSDISIIIGDGLSASAVNTNAGLFVPAFLKQAQAKGYTIAPLILASMARVAISDEIGSLLNTRLSIILIGERPGLSASDSMGAYLTYQPLPGTTDEKRNCVSNIRTQGLPPAIASEKVMHLVQNALRLQLTGVHLKDDEANLLPQF